MLVIGFLTLLVTAEVAHGIMCDNHECHPHAVCWNKRCVCAKGFVGLGDIYCSKPDEDACFLINDPHLITFGHERASVPIPCIHRIAEYSPSPNCSVSVHGKTQMFLSHLAYEVAAVVVVRVGWDALRLEIDGINNLATFTLNRSEPKVVENVTQRVSVGDKTIEVVYRDVPGTMYWEIRSADCGFTIIFRQPMATGAISEQVRAPGIVCAVKKRGAFFPSDFPLTLCATPNSKDAIGNYQAQNDLSTPELAVVLSWLKSEVPQTPGSQCQAAMGTFNTTCTDPGRSTAAVTVCGPIFSLRTLRCLSDSFDVMTLFTKCIGSVCSRDCKLCAKLDGLTRAAKCPIATLSEECNSCRVQSPGNSGRAKSKTTQEWKEGEKPYLITNHTKGANRTKIAYFKELPTMSKVTVGQKYEGGVNRSEHHDSEFLGQNVNVVIDLKGLNELNGRGVREVTRRQNYLVDSRGNYLVDIDGNYLVYNGKNDGVGVTGCDLKDSNKNRREGANRTEDDKL